MSTIKDLTIEEILSVSGGGANSATENVGMGKTNSRNNNGNSNRGGAPVTKANVAGMTIITGALTAVATTINPIAGVVVGTALTAGITASTVSSGSSSNNRDGGWHDTNPGGMAGECRW